MTKKKDLLPSEAVKYIVAGNDTLLDPKIVEIF